MYYWKECSNDCYQSAYAARKYSEVTLHLVLDPWVRPRFEQGHDDALEKHTDNASARVRSCQWYGANDEA